jgi:hypothetical protein
MGRNRSDSVASVYIYPLDVVDACSVILCFIAPCWQYINVLHRNIARVFRRQQQNHLYRNRYHCYYCHHHHHHHHKIECAGGEGRDAVGALVTFTFVGIIITIITMMIMRMTAITIIMKLLIIITTTTTTTNTTTASPAELAAARPAAHSRLSCSSARRGRVVPAGVTRYTPFVTRHTQHVKRSTLHARHHTSRVTHLSCIG